MKEEEKRIISLLKRGTDEAYKYIYDNYYDLLCRLAYSFLKDDFLAETIVDDLIYALWEGRDCLEIQISLRSYLLRAVRNRCINHLNLERERREVNFSSVNPAEEELLNAITSLDSPSLILLETELESEISRSIENLPEHCRKVFKLSRFEDKQYEEIAEELNISVNTVKYHLKNALSLLRADLKKYLTLLLFFFILP